MAVAASYYKNDNISAKTGNAVKTTVDRALGFPPKMLSMWLFILLSFKATRPRQAVRADSLNFFLFKVVFLTMNFQAYLRRTVQL